MSTNVLLSVFIVLVLVTGSGLLARPAQAASPAGSFITVFRDTVNLHAAASDIARDHALQIGFVYEHALKGMSAIVPAGRLAALEHDPRVAYVVADMERSIGAQTVHTGVQRVFADHNANLDNDGADDYRLDVDVAVIGTGVDLRHLDLNVLTGVNCSGGSPFKSSCIAVVMMTTTTVRTSPARLLRWTTDSA